MDLTGWLLRRTPPRPLVVDTPGGTAVRLAVERVVRGRAWRMAASPAEANLLVITGPGGAGFAPFVDAVWRSMSAPRVRVQIDTGEHVDDGLAVAVAELRDPRVQRAQAVRPDAEPEAGHAEKHEVHGHPHGDHDMHDGHDMAGMELPGGIPMADRASDRDGLKLDRVHVPLGPALADWPAGLVVRTVLQGDVIQEATVEVIASSTVGVGFWRGEGARWPAARWLDSCGRLLAVAGWEHAAARARWLRDEVLSGRLDRRAFDRWAERVRRSRVMRWSLAGLGVLSGAKWAATAYTGDAADRLLEWITRASTGAESDVDERLTVRALLDVLPELLVGRDLAIARLVIASLDPDTEMLAGAAVARG